MTSPPSADDISLHDAPPLHRREMAVPYFHPHRTKVPEDDLTPGEIDSLIAHGKKSFKRKYAKERIKYELAMRKCTELYKEEAQIRDLSRRLKEENDQLLEVLSDLNENSHISASLRYNLDVPANEGPALEDLYSLPDERNRFHADYGASREVAENALRRSREELLAGNMTPAACREVERDVLSGEVYRPKRFYSVLRQQMRNFVPGYPERERLEVDPNSVEYSFGFMSPDEEAAYLDALDKGHSRFLDGPLSEIERERDFATRNPMSVFNWMRNERAIGLPDSKGNDKDKESARGTIKTEPMSTLTERIDPSTVQAVVASRTPAARASKSRASLQSAALAARLTQADEFLDEDAELPSHATTASGRGKRKRDEDAGYRPKGGSSGRTARKRREDAARRAARRANAAASNLQESEAVSNTPGPDEP